LIAVSTLLMADFSQIDEDSCVSAARNPCEHT
jgi:hypothetical protein